MARVKNDKKKSASPPKPGPAERIWKILKTKRSSSKSQSAPEDSSQSQQEPTSSANVVKLQTARKRTGVQMEEVVVDSDSEEETTAAQQEVAEDSSDEENMDSRIVKYKSKDGTLKERYAPGKFEFRFFVSFVHYFRA